MITATGDDLAYNLCSLLEPHPPVISAKHAREKTRGFVWVSCHDYHSPKDWWVAEIGTDHGPPEEDESPVEWRPLPEITNGIEQSWRVVEEMKDRGWLFHILAMVDGWVVNAQHYRLSHKGRWNGKAMMTSGFVQEMGDTATEAICRAAVAALMFSPASGNGDARAAGAEG